MQYVPQTPQMLFPAPVPIPIPISSGEGGSYGGASVSLSIDSINIVAPSSDTGGEATRAMMLDLLDQLMPHLDRAVGDLLRSKTERIR